MGTCLQTQRSAYFGGDGPVAERDRLQTSPLVSEVGVSCLRQRGNRQPQYPARPERDRLPFYIPQSRDARAHQEAYRHRALHELDRCIAECVTAKYTVLAPINIMGAGGKVLFYQRKKESELRELILTGWDYCDREYS
jgi:hypothetical protein